MKKAFSLLIGLALAQGAAMAQTNVEVNLGNGVWTSVCFPFVVEDHLMWNPGISVNNYLGVGFNTFLSSNLAINIAANCHYMTRNSSYRTHLKCDSDNGYCCCSSDEGYKLVWNENNGIGGSKYVGRDEAETDFVMFAVPLKIGYRIGHFTPNFGVEYSYRMAIENNVDDIHSVGFTTGLRIDVNNKFAFTTDIYGGITNDMHHKGTLYSCQYDKRDREYNTEKLEIRDFNWRTYRIEFAVHYKLGHNND